MAKINDKDVDYFTQLIDIDKNMYYPPMERIRSIATIATESRDDPAMEYVRILAWALIKRLVEGV